MNYRVRNFFNNMSKGTASFLSNFTVSFASVLRMIVLSSLQVAQKSRKYSQLKKHNSCCILGNGPSLKDDLEAGRVDYENNDVICVNLFILSPFFKVIKPRFYFIIDGIFFRPDNERRKKKVQSLIDGLNSVDWDMYLVIPSSAVSGGVLFKSLQNPHLKIIRMNSTTIEGFRGFRHALYRWQLGMPRCQTVVNFALTAGINMGYSNIFLYGADHSWILDLRVNEANEVCYGDRHVYSTELTVTKKEGTIGRLLHAFANMFDVHWVIREYADSIGCHILNCTKGSFVDAYDRMS